VIELGKVFSTIWGSGKDFSGNNVWLIWYMSPEYCGLNPIMMEYYSLDFE
jgi:hypothetical protein